MDNFIYKYVNLHNYSNYIISLLVVVKNNCIFMLISFTFKALIFFMITVNINQLF